MLTLAFGMDMRYAIGASLVSVIATSSGAASAYVKEGYANIRIGMLFEVATSRWAQAAGRSAVAAGARSHQHAGRAVGPGLALLGLRFKRAPRFEHPAARRLRPDGGPLEGLTESCRRRADRWPITSRVCQADSP